MIELTIKEVGFGKYAHCKHSANWHISLRCPLPEFKIGFNEIPKNGDIVFLFGEYFKAHYTIHYPLENKIELQIEFSD